MACHSCCVDACVVGSYRRASSYAKPSVRKTHNSGKKHKENVRTYYNKWMEDQAQALIDKTLIDAERVIKMNPYFNASCPSAQTSAFVNPMIPPPLLPPPTGIPLPDGSLPPRPPIPPPGMRLPPFPPGMIIPNMMPSPGPPPPGMMMPPGMPPSMIPPNMPPPGMGPPNMANHPPFIHGMQMPPGFRSQGGHPMNPNPSDPNYPWNISYYMRPPMPGDPNASFNEHQSGNINKMNDFIHAPNVEQHGQTN